MTPREELSASDWKPDLSTDPSDQIGRIEDMEDMVRERDTPRFEDTKPGRLKGLLDKFENLPFMRADKIAKEANEYERSQEAKNNDDPVDYADMAYAKKLNAELSSIQNGTVPAEDQFQVTPEFFTTEHLETSNVLMNIADRTSPEMREQAGMLDKLADLKDLQQTVGLHPADAMLPTVRSELAQSQRDAEAAPTPDGAVHGMGHVLDVAQTMGHFNPYPHQNGGQLTADASGMPTRENLDVVHGRNFESSPVGRAVEGEAIDASGEVTVTLNAAQAFRQFEIDSSNARMSGKTGDAGTTALLENEAFTQDLRQLAADIQRSGFDDVTLEDYAADDPDSASSNALISVRGLVLRGQELEGQGLGSVDTSATIGHLEVAGQVQHDHDYQQMRLEQIRQSTRDQDAQSHEMEEAHGLD